MPEVITEWVQHNDEFGFLYKKCTKISPSIISRIANIPEFMEAIRENLDESFNDEVLFRVLREKSVQLYKDNKMYRSATNIIKQISKIITGDPSAWKSL